MNDRPVSNAPRPHKPVPFSPADFENHAGGIDPARVSEAAHLAARALVRGGRESNDPEITKRLVKLADKQGLEAIAEMWAASPARSLPGALWRLYALRAATLHDPEGISVFFRAGQQKAQVANAVAGVAEPPGAEEITAMANAILSGAFDGDFDIALDRSAAFCRVVALGQATLAVERGVAHPEHATALTKKARQLVRTAEDLESAAKSWRKGELD
ncbi:hypothetical protein [Arthrobacter psychrochitiniphilus]|uniref:DNA-directed RNA polymerase subunit beta n=1 Tax=Arthrobacter psychrochitiniphilus TaxID=291045 RepID=A0A2V3DS54_9MICC|nr:hypothetical protein [Arthrobacter psychrochitiniphilus]NYG19055.1 hypothetical protein [Arthrobacter psychrochitiniphilus]PXA65970.1 hypothetical protein CVS29_08165 [Arthrobacter psychrochitiniphilus]